MEDRANKPRDDKKLFNDIGYSRQLLIGTAFYCPFSLVKKAILRLLGATIGKGVYIGPGTMIISPDFSKVVIGDEVFIAPQAMIKVDTLSIGEQSHIGYQCLLSGTSLSIGKRCNISNRTFIDSDYAPVVLEDDVTIAASVIISSHDGSYKPPRGRGMKSSPVVVRDHAFVGNHATVLPGITIGNRAIVGAGAVVTKDVPDDSVVVGVPARPLEGRTW